MNEPVKIPLKVNYIIHSTVASVTERFETAYKGFEDAKTEGQVEREQKSLGWFVVFEGSREAMHFGYEKPAMEKGDKVEITIKVIP